MAPNRSSRSFNDERSDGSILSEYSGLTCSIVASGMFEVVPRRYSAKNNLEESTGSGFRASLVGYLGYMPG